MYSILNNLKQEFKQGTTLNKLIYLNVGLFLLFSILGVFSFMFQFDLNPILNKLYLPAENSKLLSQPWTFITYMFLHTSFLHLLFNMICLHFAGKIFLQYLNPKQLLSTYILGGISGGLLFIIAYNYVPALIGYTQNAQALGASAAVLAASMPSAIFAEAAVSIAAIAPSKAGGGAPGSPIGAPPIGGPPIASPIGSPPIGGAPIGSPIGAIPSRGLPPAAAPSPHAGGGMPSPSMSAIGPGPPGIISA